MICTLLFCHTVEDLENVLHPYSGQSTPMMFDKFLFPFPRPLWLFHFHRQPAWKTPQSFRAENCAVNADDMFPHFKDLVDERTGTENRSECLQVFDHHETLLKGHWVHEIWQNLDNSGFSSTKMMHLGNRIFSSYFLKGLSI